VNAFLHFLNSGSKLNGSTAAISFCGAKTSWHEKAGARSVFKFRLELAEDLDVEAASPESLPHSRMIPSAVKLEVWRRDKGQCVMCGAEDNLHFDHELPYSKGGTSRTAKNIRLLCARHNLSKSDKIQ
jgi:HNH endonuclease